MDFPNCTLVPDLPQLRLEQPLSSKIEHHLLNPQLRLQIRSLALIEEIVAFRACEEKVVAFVIAIGAGIPRAERVKGLDIAETDESRFAINVHKGRDRCRRL